MMNPTGMSTCDLHHTINLAELRYLRLAILMRVDIFKPDRLQTTKEAHLNLGLLAHKAEHSRRDQMTKAVKRRLA